MQGMMVLITFIKNSVNEKSIDSYSVLFFFD